ncbi:MAG: condensation domain-containing protein [Jatrophihabitans sp.]
MSTDEQGPVRSVPVPFEGLGAGEAPLTWAQLDVWQSSTDSGAAVTIGGVHQMPAGTTVEDVLEVLRFIMSRHQALRTRLRLGPDGRPRQVCSTSGAASLLVVDAAGEEPDACAQRIKVRLERQGFDYEQDWPVRMAVITVDGLVSHVVTIYLHLAVDAAGIEVVVADLAARDPLTGAAAGPITAIQPLELARRQARPAARRQSEASLRHLEQVLRTVPAAMFGDPDPDRPARYRRISYRSPASELALRRIVAEHTVSSSSAVLAMFAVGLARRLQRDLVWAMVLVNNRFRPGLADSACQLAQSSPYRIDLAGLSLAEAVSQTQRNLLHTYKTAYYDSRQHDELIARLGRELPEPVDLCCYYNDRSGGRPAAAAGAPITEDQLRDAVALSSWTEDTEHALPAAPMFMNVNDPPGLIELQVSFDARHFTVADMVALCGEIERAAVQAAITPTAPAGASLRVGLPA